MTQSSFFDRLLAFLLCREVLLESAEVAVQIEQQRDPVEVLRRPRIQVIETAANFMLDSGMRIK